MNRTAFLLAPRQRAVFLLHRLFHGISGSVSSPVYRYSCCSFKCHSVSLLDRKRRLIAPYRPRNMATNQHPQGIIDVAEEKLLKDVLSMVLSHCKTAGDRTQSIVKFKTPDELAALVDFEIGDGPVDSGSLKKLCEAAFEYGVNTDHPRFFNQQFAGTDKYGLAGDLVVTAMNANVHTFEVAPFFVMTEKAVLRRCLKLFGFQTGEGSFCPGGTYSAMLAMHLARYRKCPSIKSDGLFGSQRLVAFASKQAHYSAAKNATLLGIGTKNCIEIPCDANGKMIVKELEAAIVKTKEEGAIPFYAVATAGTTVLGAFDPFNEIADVCEKHGLWLHTDACWGGSALFSKKYRHLCNGVERSDSVMWNAHKLMQMPIQCSLLLVKEEGLMNKANACEVPYLFQPAKPYDVKYDLGRDLIQCGRRGDAMKLWLAWKARGDEGFEKHVDKAFDNAEYLLELLKKRENFRLVIDKPEFTNVSFWYIPPSLRGQKEDESFWQKIHLVAPKIKSRMQKTGSLLIGYQPVGSVVNFFRMIVIGNGATREDMEFVLDEIERNGNDL